MNVERVSVQFCCKTCGGEFTLEQDAPFIRYLERGSPVPMRCPYCGTDRISEFLGRNG